MPASSSPRLLRAKALECVSLVGMAVGRERFRGDAGAVMAFMQQLATAPMDADDPTQSYMLQVCKGWGEGHFCFASSLTREVVCV